MKDEIIVGLFGVLATCITQIIIHVISKIVDTRSKKNESIINYIEPLKRQVEDNYEKLKYNRARKKVKGKKNSIRWIEGKDIKVFSDIQGNGVIWFYNYGANLGTTCYLLSCLIAYAHHVKQHMPFINFDAKDREKISFYISHMQEILNRHLGIYTIVQYDIGKVMFDNDNFNSLITYKQFCEMVLSTDTADYCCFVQVFNFILNIANDERRQQCDDLIKHLESFNEYLNSLY